MRVPGPSTFPGPVTYPGPPPRGQGDIVQGTDAGELVTQSGPYPASDSGTGTEAGQLRPSDSDTGSGTDNGTVFSSVRVGDQDTSRLPSTTPQDADGGSGTDSPPGHGGAVFIAVTLSSAETGHGADGR